MTAILSLFEKKFLPLTVSLGVHAIVALMLLKEWVSPSPPQEIRRPNFVQASLVQLEARPQQAAPANAPQVVDLRRREAERQRQEAERQQAAQRRQEQQRRQAEEARKQEANRKAEAERKAKAEADRQRQQEQRQQEQRQQEQRQQEQRRQQEQQAFEQALAREQAQLAEESYAVAAQSYIAAISQRIERNWDRPPSARRDMECELLIRLVPTGRVISVDVVRGSGNALFDRSAIQAVQRAEQFPEIRDMPPEIFERYYRELRLVFKPQDLRQ